MHDTHIEEPLRLLHLAVLDIVRVMNGPQRDETLIREAGIKLDRALFPLLVAIEKFGPIGVVDLAEGVGRDYTTVSRQVAKLEALGLIQRRGAEADRRVREAVVTDEGKMINQRIDAARLRLMTPMFADWEPRQVEDLVRLTRKFADALTGALPPPKS